MDLFSNIDIEECPKCPIYGCKVALTGEFSIGRQATRSVLLKLGATEVRYDKLTRSTHVLVIGQDPNAETINMLNLYRHDGYNISVLTPLDIQKIQNGIYSPYSVPKENIKRLHITKDIVWWQMPEIANLKNERTASPIDLSLTDAPLYGKELFVHESIFNSRPQLFQQIGNLGGYANTQIDLETDAIVIPKNLPQEICKCVEDFYNFSKSTIFNTPFIIFEELVEYLQQIEKK